MQRAVQRDGRDNTCSLVLTTGRLKRAARDSRFATYLNGASASPGANGQNPRLNPSRSCLKLLKESRAVLIPIEVVTDDERWRNSIATIKRSANVAGKVGIGLVQDEVKGLTARLQSIVAAEHMQAAVSAHSASAGCRRDLARNGGASIGHRTAFSKLRVADSRLYSQCGCSARAGASASFSPLATLPDWRPHPELLCLQTPSDCVLSYEQAANELLDICVANPNVELADALKRRHSARIRPANDSIQSLLAA